MSPIYTLCLFKINFNNILTAMFILFKWCFSTLRVSDTIVSFFTFPTYINFRTSRKKNENNARDNIYAVQQDTQSVLMSEFIQH